MDPPSQESEFDTSGIDGHFSSSSSDDDHMSSSSSDDELFEELDEEWAVAFALSTACSNISDFFTENELLGQYTVDPLVGVKDYLATLRAAPWMFKVLTNFTMSEFDQLASLVVPTIKNHARSTGLRHGVGGRPSKLSPEQRLLNFIIFMKHDNAVRYDAFRWNWNPGSMCDDALFIASCINVSIADEIRWPTPEERRNLSSRLPQFPGCIGMIDGTLVKIRRPYNNPEHRRWFNGRKKMYAMNNTVIIDHSGLFIHLDVGYPGSFHDVNILRQSDVYHNWRQHFVHEDDYFEYLLGDPGYIGEDHFIMRRVGTLEIAPHANMSAIIAYNKMHAGFRVQVEWGIGGLKRKWRRLMKQFDSSKAKYYQLFYSAALLTNFLHRRRMDFTIEFVGDQQADETDFGWEGDF